MFAMNANAQLEAIERLVLPGPVIAGHAEYESQCTACHARFARGSQRQLCLTCHEEVAEDFATGTGFHSRSPDVADRPCAECHTEHQGRDADILGLDAAAFDHGLTDFPLRGSHIDAECEDCHVTPSFHEAAEQCVDCHADDDQHMGNLGAECADCHSETEWAETRFDHFAETDYALTGAHESLTCVSCHVGEQYEETPNECVDCHREDDEHMGNNGPQCRDCHTTSDWSELKFDHFTRTGFALSDGHSGLACESCHEGNKLEVSLSSECYDCHAEDDVHEGVNGIECTDCHRATTWLDVSFDHERDAGFALNGAHDELMCVDCHVTPVATALPPTECFGCHEDDDPHAGQLGSTCSSCHGEILWTENVRFDHDLTVFPLLGRHDALECEDCHATPKFHDAPGECIDCHLEDDAHEGRFGAGCALCHNPADWLLWRFDHDTQTDFALDGAHADLNCHACHREPVADSVQLPMTCGSCHRRDDVHRGEFGPDCAECHSTESFESPRIVR